MKEKDNLMKKKEITETNIKKLHSLEKKLREIEEVKGKDKNTKEKMIEEILKEHIPIFRKMLEDLEKAKEKIYPFNSDPLTALSLNREAEEKALKIYKEFYTEKNFTIPASNCIIHN